MNIRNFDNIRQEEVDFVIPKLDKDIPLGIDPFLLFKSRNLEFKELHNKIISVFNEGIRLFGKNKLKDARLIINFPEVKEIGLGYGKKTKHGSGMGEFFNNLLLETLGNSPNLVSRGVKHIEEMQLVSIGIAADRVSDMTANIIKEYLIEYTQKQCNLWNLQLNSNVPLGHIFDFQNFEWYDNYFDLPVNNNNEPILFVPRWFVRKLPWINFEDYAKSEFSNFLRAKNVKTNLKLGVNDKKKIIEVSRKEIERIDYYISKKEKNASDALPAEFKIPASKTINTAENFINELKTLPTGNQFATKYQHLQLEILNFLFVPDLIDGKLEQSTISGTERRDIIFVNDSEKTFFDFIRNNHNNFLVVFEAKNVVSLTAGNYNQMGTYLGEKVGFCGFVITRNVESQSNKLKAISIYNNSKRIIISLSDEDIIQMLQIKMKGNDPMRHLQKRYREFMVLIQ